MAIKWNQQGATGPQGPAGPQGPKGDAGAPGTGATVASLTSGDPNCATGGASVTDGRGNIAYACNGATGAQGPKGDPGPTGTPGPGATVASLANGDANCPNGGASITDGSGNAAYACNGASGGTDLQPFSASSTNFLGLPSTGFAIADYLTVPGLTVQVAPTATSTYLVSADVFAAQASVDSSQLVCRLFIDGAPDAAEGIASMDGSVMGMSVPIISQVVLGGGTHTIEVRCVVAGTGVKVGGPDGQSTLTGFKAG